MRSLRSGFTLLEIVIVVFLLSVISMFIFGTFLRYRDAQQFLAVQVDIRSLLAETRQRTLAAETVNHFGIFFASSSLTVYEGSYVPSSTTNRIFSFPGISIIPGLAGGTTTLSFARLSGIPNATGTILLVHERSLESTSIEITSAGLVEE